MTPSELNLAARAYSARTKSEQEFASLMNYQLATLIRAAVWSKRMPEYRSPFEAKPKQIEQSDDALFASVLALNAAMGGTIEG